jgi:hypothetical protein
MITNLFGTQASQTADTLTIDLVDLGVSPAATAESILAAIIKRAIVYYSISISDEFGDSIVDEFGNSIDIDGEELPIEITYSHTRRYQRRRIENSIRLAIVDQSTLYASNP